MRRPGEAPLLSVFGLILLIAGCASTKVFVNPADYPASEAATVRVDFDAGAVMAFAMGNHCYYVCDQGSSLPPNGRLGYREMANSNVNVVYFFESPDHHKVNSLRKITEGTGANKKAYWADISVANNGTFTTTTIVKIAPYDKDKIPAEPATIVGSVMPGASIEWRRPPGQMTLQFIYSSSNTLGKLGPVQVEAGKTYVVKWPWAHVQPVTKPE